MGGGGGGGGVAVWKLLMGSERVTVKARMLEHGTECGNEVRRSNLVAVA